jgi:hypothetical protein
MQVYQALKPFDCVEFAVMPATLDKLDKADLQAMSSRPHGHAEGCGGFALAVAGENNQ